MVRVRGIQGSQLFSSGQLNFSETFRMNVYYLYGLQIEWNFYAATGTRGTLYRICKTGGGSRKVVGIILRTPETRAG